MHVDAARLSFEEVEVFMNDLCRARLKDTKDMPIVIVGNKGDVPDELRQVSKAEASKFAEDNGCPLIGTRASRSCALVVRERHMG
jgi:hypothetical protein